ncbi:non-canonical purine NTP pyrophosphatase [Streptomyces sp. L2]|uniref:non-canonical purine NTP pyrophosphatase n=1 Tax=Streptomyces sp. L2 TaxID=2162665 RepID=UPI001011AB1F|nr:non-canonical purine NTP pyrophosphatase [Streptomyces sp. L2]
MTPPPPAGVLIATTNPFKVERWRRVLQGVTSLVLPGDLHLSLTVEEHAATTTENARAKALAWHHYASPIPVLADDLGLFIQALNGRPGALMKTWDGQIPESATESERMTVLAQTVRDLTDTTCYLETTVAVATSSGRIGHRTLRQHGRIDKTCTLLPHTQGPLLERVFIFDGYDTSWLDMAASQQREVDARLRREVTELLDLHAGEVPAPFGKRAAAPVTADGSARRGTRR